MFNETENETPTPLPLPVAAGDMSLQPPPPAVAILEDPQIQELAQLFAGMMEKVKTETCALLPPDVLELLNDCESDKEKQKLLHELKESIQKYANSVIVRQASIDRVIDTARDLISKKIKSAREMQKKRAELHFTREKTEVEAHNARHTELAHRDLKLEQEAKVFELRMLEAKNEEQLRLQKFEEDVLMLEREKQLLKARHENQVLTWKGKLEIEELKHEGGFRAKEMESETRLRIEDANFKAAKFKVDRIALEQNIIKEKLKIVAEATKNARVALGGNDGKNAKDIAEMATRLMTQRGLFELPYAWTRS